MNKRWAMVCLMAGVAGVAACVGSGADDDVGEVERASVDIAASDGAEFIHPCKLYGCDDDNHCTTDTCTPTGCVHQDVGDGCMPEGCLVYYNKCEYESLCPDNSWQQIICNYDTPTWCKPSKGPCAHEAIVCCQPTL